MQPINLRLLSEGRPASSPVVPRRNLPSSPVHPAVHLFETGIGPYLFVVNGSQVYGLEQAEYARLWQAMRVDDAAGVDDLLKEFELLSAPMIDDTPVVSPPTKALSLAVAQTCNLGCTYCYAQQGDFGGPRKMMSREVALMAVDHLLQQAKMGDRVNLAFLGGEPMANRTTLREATEYAAARAQTKGVHMGFSVTTNGTLLDSADCAFFEKHGFAVTISLDGVGEVHDRLRPFKNGAGSYRHILQRVSPLLAAQRRMQVSARVTVTPQNLCLSATLRELVDLGFHSVGFSPMLSSPTERDELGRDDLDVMLEQMIQCGCEFERRVVAGQRYPFANMVNALREIHKGTHRPYPCGAGAGYMGVSADGDLSACHRFVRDEAGAMGDLKHGINGERQNQWLADRHVHRQEPCASCWARYLCGGGCHHEVIHRGRPACDYIRGWLHYCLGAYARMLAKCPDYFGVSGSVAAK